MKKFKYELLIKIQNAYNLLLTLSGLLGKAMTQMFRFCMILKALDLAVRILESMPDLSCLTRLTDVLEQQLETRVNQLNEQDFSINYAITNQIY